ncbi:MAG: cyclic lactone autoinducer peptide [Lachnospiraceae bacterium]
MKEYPDVLLRKNAVQGMVLWMLERIAQAMCKVSANSLCICIFHQPAEPEDLEVFGAF